MMIGKSPRMIDIAQRGREMCIQAAAMACVSSKGFVRVLCFTPPLGTEVVYVIDARLELARFLAWLDRGHTRVERVCMKPSLIACSGGKSFNCMFAFAR